MASNKRKDNFEYNSSNQKVGESFNYIKEDSTNNLYSEDFVYKFEDNKIKFTNDVGNSGLEDNGMHTNLHEDKKAMSDDSWKDQQTSTSSTSTSSGASSTASSSASSSAATSSSAAAASTSGALTTVATVATTAVVVVVGGTLTIYSQKVEKPQIVEVEALEASSDTIFFSIMIGNDYEKIMSGEENDACDITVELTCESYSDFRATESILNFGVSETKFENLLPETEYTINVYLNSIIGIENSILGLETEYLIDPLTITTESALIIPESISFTDESVTIEVGDTYQLAYTVSPEGADDQVYWQTDDHDYISVVDGLVTGLAIGKGVVYAQSIYDSEIYAEIEITVNEKKPTSITLTEEETTLNIGDTYQILVESIEPEGATQDVTYLSNDETVVTVDEEGLVTAVGSGETTVKVTCVADESIFTEITITVLEEDVVLPTEITSEELEISLDVGDTHQIEYTVLPEDTTDKSVTFDVNDETVVTVSDDGLIAAVGPGEASVTIISVADDSVYLDLNVYVEYPAPEAIILDSEEEITLKVGQEVEIGYSLEPEESFPDVEWTTSDDTVAEVSDGIIYGKYEGTAVITATSVKDNSVSASLTVNVEASYTLTMKKSYDPLGNLTFYGSFECSGTSLEYGEHYLYLYEQGTLPTRAPHRANNNEESIVARAYFETDISEEQPINFDYEGNFDDNGSYDWAILGYDEELQDNVMLDHGTIDFSSLEERDADPSNYLYFKRTDLKYGADVIDAIYDVYVDVENDDVTYDAYAISLYGTDATTSDPLYVAQVSKLKEFVTLEFSESPGVLEGNYNCVVNAYLESSQETVELYSQTVDFSSIDATSTDVVNSASYLMEQTHHNSYRTVMTIESSVNLTYSELFVNIYDENDEEVYTEAAFSSIGNNQFNCNYSDVVEVLCGQENMTLEVSALINREHVTIYSSKESFDVYMEELPYVDGCVHVEEEDNRDFGESTPTGTIDFYFTLEASATLISEYESFVIEFDYGPELELSGVLEDVQPNVRTYFEVSADLEECPTNVSYTVYGIDSEGNRVTIYAEYAQLQV